MSVEGLVVVVTGSARGMGREYVRGFLRGGAKVVATDLAWPPSGVSNDDEDFLAEIRDHGNVLAETMDVTIDAHVHRVFDAAMRRFGTIDVLINNAGLRQRDLYPPHGSVTLLETAVGDWQRMFDTHVFSAVRVLKTFTAPMLAQRRGSIINVGSSGWAGQARASREMPYKAAKAALATLTFYAAHELAPHNIAVNLLLPGHTRSTGSDEQEAARAAIRARLTPERPPVRPVRVKPDHVMPLALFLAQQDASGVTGQEISALQWNREHGHGGLETWGYAPDLAAAQAEGDV